MLLLIIKTANVNYLLLNIILLNIKINFYYFSNFAKNNFYVAKSKVNESLQHTAHKNENYEQVEKPKSINYLDYQFIIKVKFASIDCMKF